MSTKLASTPKKSVEHPPYKDMIIAAIVNLKDRSGSSRQAIKKYIHANYKVKDNADTFIRYCIKTGVEQGIFIQPKGSSGPLKLAKKPTEKKEKKPAVKKEVKKAATKPKAKKASAKKATTKKVAKKVVKKPTSAKAKLMAKKKAVKKASSKSKKTASPSKN